MAGRAATAMSKVRRLARASMKTNHARDLDFPQYARREITCLTNDEFLDVFIGAGLLDRLVASKVPAPTTTRDFMNEMLFSHLTVMNAWDRG